MPDYIRVSVPEIPTAKISANRTAGPAPIAIQFYDRSTGFPTEWLWDFGDGTNSTLKNPVHAYSYGGNYTINLVASNSLGNTSVTAANYIKATGTGPIPVVDADFSANATSGQAPFAVAFTDLSTGSPTSWNWSFGDGMFSEEQNPGHTYNVSGNFTVNLTIWDVVGSTSSTGRSDYIRVGSGIPVTILDVVRADFSFNTTGIAPYSVEFRDYSHESPTKWNWSFGDGTFSEEQNPVHVYTGGSNFTISLNASNAFTYDIQTADYNFAQFAKPAYNAEIMFSSVSSKMFQGEPYLTRIYVKNTGSRTWSGDPTSSDYVYIQGLGGSFGDAKKFNLTFTPMLFENETVAPGGTYDFFFFMESPDTIGNYSPAFRMSSASSGQFGEISNITVEVIKNPFNPIVQTDGSKLYTTTFGNLSSGMTVSIVGPKVYLDKLNASGYQDPRFLINPTLKSEVFNFTLNDTFNYADITIKYDPTKVSDPANLSISYFNTTTGNFTFVPSTVDTVNHTVTARVTHFSIYEILDQIIYMALPFLAQNDMGWMDAGSTDYWTLNPDLSSFGSTSFANGAAFPPGTYTIYTSGSYSNVYIDMPPFYSGCASGWAQADNNQDDWSGMYIVYNNPSGLSDRQVKTVRSSSGVLTITHGGGPISMYNRHTSNPVCGGVSYKLYYTDGPVIQDPTLDHNKQLMNDALILKIAGFDQAYTAYLKGIGCIIAGTGESSKDRLQSLIHYALFLGNSLSDVNAFAEGYLACQAIVEPNPPVADFQISPAYGPSPLTVSFTEISTSTPTEWYWKFGDKTYSSVQNPGEHTYTKEGTYPVTLEVKRGDKSSKKTRMVIVNPPDHHGYVQCSNLQNFIDYQDCVNYNGRAYCEGLCASERPECYIQDTTGSILHDDIELYTSLKNSWEWQRASCGQNAILNIAKEGNMDLFPSKNILSEWGYKNKSSCPNAGSSYAFDNPGGKDVYFAAIINRDIEVWSEERNAFVPFFHEVAAELKPGKDKNNINSWKFYNYGEVITPGSAVSIKLPPYGQIPKALGADKCYTTIAIKKVSGWYGDLGYHYNSIYQKFWVDENGEIVNAQNTGCGQDHALDAGISPCPAGDEYC
jgi:PKD repeat protein